MSALSAHTPSRRWHTIRRVFAERRMLAMLLLSFGAGMPFGAIFGTLNAWLTEVGVTPAAIGTLALLALPYAFKYLWAPAFQRARAIPGLNWLGGRRSWLFVLQACILALIGMLSLSKPASAIGFIAVISLMIAALSATHDIILDAWRIEVARDDADKDLMSAIYQFGYKGAGFVSGFGALILASYVGWSLTYLCIAAFMGLAILGTLIAREPEVGRDVNASGISFFRSVPSRIATPATLVVAVGWGIAVAMIAMFVADALFLDKPVNGSAYVREQGPIILGLTVVLPAIVAAVLVFRFSAHAAELGGVSLSSGELRQERLRRPLFRAVLDPLMDMVFRLRWAVVLVLALTLTYRFTDAVWGSFAFPFYMGQDFGALGHSKADVAVASKLVGVIATLMGSAIGIVAIAFFGRMPVFFVGGVVAAVTNLLYADLAAGAQGMDAFLQFTGLGPPLQALAGWAAILSPEGAGADQGQRMARLMVTILAENVAGGLALVALTAYLTSVVSVQFAAVQYALLASLTNLIGTLGRPWLGSLIETEGYVTVFVATFWLGGVAVVLSALEWWRQAYEARMRDRQADAAGNSAELNRDTAATSSV